jgi:predicted transcriptional regulator
LVLGVLAVWLVVVALVLLWARNDAIEGLAMVEEAQARSSPADLLEGRATEPLAKARTSFQSSSRLMGSPVLAPLRLLPVLGRQLRSGEALTQAAAEISGIGVDVVAEAKQSLSKPHATGPERIVLMRDLSRLSAGAEARLGSVELGPGRALVGPLASKRRELEEKLTDARTGLRDSGTALEGLAGLLAGPRRYLVLAANNSEMRSGSGMFLSAGELETENGDLSLGEFRSTGELTLPPEVAPAIEDADLEARWGSLIPNQEWRNLGVTPRFPVSAALASRMWTARGGKPVDGVLALDPLTLQGVLRATGPVMVDDKTVTADNVDDFLLHDQYAGIENVTDAQTARREQLGEIAKSALEALQERDWDLGDLATGLADAARGRHLLAWSSRPEEQQAWSAAKVDGTLSSNSLAVSVLNRGGNKLDRFLQVEAKLRFERKDETPSATLEILLQNTTPDGESGYVAGPYPGSGVGAGDYVGLLSVNLPAKADAVTVEGRETFAAAGPDGPTKVVAVPVTIKKGSAQSLVFRFRLPADCPALRVEPSARVPPVRWTGPSDSWESGDGHIVSW